MSEQRSSSFRGSKSSSSLFRSDSILSETDEEDEIVSGRTLTEEASIEISESQLPPRRAFRRSGRNHHNKSDDFVVDLMVDHSDRSFELLETSGRGWIEESFRGNFQTIPSGRRIPAMMEGMASRSISEDSDFLEPIHQPTKPTTKPTGKSVLTLLADHTIAVDAPATDPSVQEVQALHQILSDVAIPPLPLDIVEGVLEMERQGQPVHQDLPESTISIRPQRAIALLTAKSGRHFLLFQLPSYFAKAFLRLLIRLLSYETDQVYPEMGPQTSKIELESPPLPDHSTIRPHLRYNVARFQCYWPADDEYPAISVLFKLLEAAPGELATPLARLLGLLSIGGLNTQQLHEWFGLVQKTTLGPTTRIALVHALQTAAAGAARSHVHKTPPRHFFCFGHAEGLQKTVHALGTWPFRNDFGMALWFRVERFDGNPILFSARSEDGGGIEVSLVRMPSLVSDACTIEVSIYDSKVKEATQKLQVGACLLLPRIWYHLAIRHTRSRLPGVFSLGQRSQISVIVDGKPMLTAELPFPKVSEADFEESSSSLLGLRRSVNNSRLSLNLCLGKDFEGETGTLYLFNDSVSDASFKALFEATGGKVGTVRKMTSSRDAWDARASSIVRESRVLDENQMDDLVPRSRKRVLRENALSVLDIMVEFFDEWDEYELPSVLHRGNFASKVLVVWDPKRTLNKQVVELHMGAHAEMKDMSSWTINSVPDVLRSLGGIQALLPIFKSFLSANGELGLHGGIAKGELAKQPIARIIASLVNMLHAFTSDFCGNARELLRCAGIDVIADLLTVSKKIATGKVLSNSLFEATCSDTHIAAELVQSILRLESGCPNNIALEAKIFNRLLFNAPLWLEGSTRYNSNALHSVLLPVLSHITTSNPERVRDCVRVKDLVMGLSSCVGSAATPHRGALGGSDPQPSNILLGIIFTILSLGVTVKDLSPFLNFISSRLNPPEESSPKYQLSEADIETMVGACTVLLFLFKQKPAVPGLFESFAQCCGSAHAGAGWIVCSIINIENDEIRALGIRCLKSYLAATSAGPDEVLSLGPSLTQGRDVDNAKVSDVAANVRRASNRIRERLAEGLAAMGTAGRTSKPASPRVIYKFLWHVLRSRRYLLSTYTYASLLDLLTDDDDLHSSSLSEPTYLKEHLVPKLSGLPFGCVLDVTWARWALNENGKLVSKSIVNPLCAGLILRLLRFLKQDQKDNWLRDLFSLANSSRKSVAMLANLPDWEPSIFQLISDTLESVRALSVDGDGSEEQGENHESALIDLPTAKQRLDTCLDMYATLLGHLLRGGSDKVLDAVASTASLQRTCVNGTSVLLMILSRFCSNIFDFGTILEIGSFSAEAWKDIDLDHDSLPLKQSARMVTEAIINQGTKGLDMPTAIRSWRSLRHIAEIIVAVIVKCRLGTVQLFDYKVHRGAAIDAVSGGLHGFRLPDGRLHGISAEDYSKFSRLEQVEDEAENDTSRRLSVCLSAQILILLDSYIFPESVESQQTAQSHGKALVKSSDARLGTSQGPLAATAMRLSFLLLALLEPCGVKFLQCVSRLRTMLDWSLQLILESSTEDQSASGLNQEFVRIDNLIIAALLHTHRALGRCSALLSEIESSSHSKYFESREAHKRSHRRLFRSTKELRDVVWMILSKRNDVVKSVLSSEAYVALHESVKDMEGVDDSAVKEEKGVKDNSIRAFLASGWVKGFQDVECRFELAIPEQVAIDSSQVDENSPESPVEGVFLIEKMARETEAIQIEFEKALDSCFKSYLEGQRKWTETDAVRDLEFEGDSTLKRLTDRERIDIVDSGKETALRRATAETRWRATEKNTVDVWREPKYLIVPSFTDRLGRRQVLVENKDFDAHVEARYDTLDSQAEDANVDKGKHDLSEVMRRNAEAFAVGDMDDGNTTDDDSFLHSSDGESTGGESTAEMSTDTSDGDDNESQREVEATNASEQKLVNALDVDASWDKISQEDVDIDEEGDVDSWAKNFLWMYGETVVARFEPVMVITLQSYVLGKLLVTTDCLYFLPTESEVNIMTKEAKQNGESDMKPRRWRLVGLTEVYGRRFMLRHQALELFFSDSSDLLLNFPTGTKDRDRFHAKLRNSCKLPMLWSPRTLNPRTAFRKSKMTEMWRKRKITTFEYLLAINRIAGRSFNDLTQYPVFPWVIADYTSENINLSDTRVYRDLCKPIGALNDNRLAQLLERYNELESFGFTEAEKFLYGSHYSSPGIVLHYLMRQEPFTTMHIQLQSGRFDCPDRLFLDIASSWKSCMTSSSDMKELIPEFFYMPEIFLNSNHFPLGRTQSGLNVDNVGLPPWAKGSAYEFVRINRLALESEYVSQNLPVWIDLIFGFKQRGPEAEAAHNIFHHLSYEGSVDLDKIASEVDRQAAESHIQNFGQTPSQLIVLDPHPARLGPDESWKPLISDSSAAGRLRCHTPSKQFANRRSEHAKGAVLKLMVLADVIYAVYADMSVGTYRWNPSNKKDRLRMERIRYMPGRELSTSRSSLKRGSEVASTVGSKYALDVSSFALAMTGFSKEDLRRKSVIPSNILLSHGDSPVSSLEGTFFVASCGYWDETVKIHSADGFRVVASETGGHNGAVRCVSTGDGGGIMASGGEDATVRIWVLDDSDLATSLCDGYVKTALGPPTDGEPLLRCCHVLWGHDQPVLCVDMNSDLDVVVSGSQSGRICIHSVRRGEFIRAFTPPPIVKGRSCGAARKIKVGVTGLIVVHMQDKSLHTYTLNGMRLISRKTGENLNDMRLCNSDQLLITGGEECQVKIRTISDLNVCAMLNLAKHGPVTCIGLTPDDLNPAEQYLFIGSDDGMITIVDHDPLGNDDEAEEF